MIYPKPNKIVYIYWCVLEVFNNPCIEFSFKLAKILSKRSKLIYFTIFLQVFFVVLQFYSPQPTALTISRKKTNSDDWENWQFFAEDCSTFGLPNNEPLRTPTSVNCIQFDR